MLDRIRELLETDTAGTVYLGLIGITGTGTGIGISLLQQVEAWLRIGSLIVGIAVGVATFISIIRKKK